MSERVDRFIRRPGRLLPALCAALLLCGAPQNAVPADSPGTQPSPAPKPTPPLPQIASFEGGVEAAIDAPWRIEPDYQSPEGSYGTIPIIVSIHDASLQRDPERLTPLGQFCEITVVEEKSRYTIDPRTKVFTAQDLAEIERSDKWPMDTDVARNHRICRRWAGDVCGANQHLEVGTSAEWHGTLLYKPRASYPGDDVRLTVQARVARAGQSCGAPRGLWLDAPMDRLGPVPEGNAFVILNRLSVHLGEEPLPRFDANWAYGDLHYHSQGTDNEGESAYAYRPTLQAMRAMGLDFLFATDHASDSVQITDVDPIIVDNVDIDLPWYVDVFSPALTELAHLLESFIERKGIQIGAQTDAQAGRDMSPQRFASMLGVLNDPGGANEQVMRPGGSRRAPRIFLGGEVDVIPEMSANERGEGYIAYGNGASYNWRSSCTDWPAELNQLDKWTDLLICDSPWTLGDEETFEGGRFKVQDVQGMGESYHYARQHMLHLPTDRARADAFVSGSTGLWGGAMRRLGPAVAASGMEDEQQSVLYRDYTAEQKGYAFLAHPAEGASGKGIDRLGPDIVPYSDVQLRSAFESQAILGLQLWNEDSRLNSGGSGSASWLGFPIQPWDLASGGEGNRFRWARWTRKQPKGAYAEIHHGLADWDRMLQWGIRPSQTAGLTWLAPGQPRRVFMAGGSDAHGDWNYRRQGRMGGMKAVTDSAIGKPRNLVHVGSSRPDTVLDGSGQPLGAIGQAQVTSALASGNFAVTDGPALRIVVDTNGNGLIDASDVPMGGVTQVPFPGTQLPVIVEWKSTDEFGPLASIDLYVGVADDLTDRTLVYAPENHGVHSEITKSGALGRSFLDSNGVAHRELRDGYMADPSGRLRIIPTVGEAEQGRRRLLLRPNDYVVGRRRVVLPVDGECVPNHHWCTKPGHTNDEECEWECTDSTPAEYHFDSVQTPERLFVRAFARTALKAGALCDEMPPNVSTAGGVAMSTGQCIERLAFTNPVWVENTSAPPQGDYRVSCSPASLAMASGGGQAMATCSILSIDSFSADIALRCANPLALASCSLSPSTVRPPANGVVQATLRVSTQLLTRTGQFTLHVEGRVGSLVRSTDVALTIGGTGRLLAVFDPVLKAPSCIASVGFSCETGPLVAGRASGGSEPNTPNTINASCTDGATGPLMGRWPANDAIKVSTADGGSFLPGKTVNIEAIVFASTSPSSEAADFFYSASAAKPVWTLIGSIVPSVAGAQTLSASYTLPAGRLQAVRVQYRQGGSAQPCVAGARNDRDDLAFAVGTAP